MRTLLLALSLLTIIPCYSQDSLGVSSLTLDDCITMALEKNIQLKQARNNELIAESNRFQSIMNFFPSVNAGINYDFYFGNFFDQNAARQVSETSNSSNPNVSANMVLFNGFSNHFNLQQRKHELTAASANTERSRLDVESNILAFYLSVILDKENIKISKERVDLLEAQLEREQKRESVGVGSLESVYNFQSQLANQRLELNNLENQLKRDLLTLFQAMQLDPEGSYEVQPYAVAESELLLESEPFEQILEESINSSPRLKASHATYMASKFQLKASRAQFYPTVNAFGRIGSNYSSNGARNPSTGEFTPNATFSDQMTFNEFEYLNLSLNIPIFTRYQTKNRVQTAKVGMANAELDVAQAINTVTNLVQVAYLDLVNAQQTYVSAKENLGATTQTFEFMKKRFETGNTDFYTYLESLNNKNRAEVQLVNAKYSIVFRQKILQLYRGKLSQSE